jgi:serine phosphatase RsbU (regulator of sigma subunit)
MIIADVSGHGVQAGMITTAAKASLHTLVQQGVDTPGALLKAMNDSILATTQQALLMTCLVAVISPREQQIRYANAGHDFPYLCRKSTGTAELLENPASFPLGLDPNNIFYEMAAAFNPGDTFVLYSDGIHECTNGTEDFGHMRLERCLSSLIGQSPEEWVRHVLHALSEFRGDENLRDDVTLVVASLGDTI